MIELVIVVIAFGGAGFVLYNGFFNTGDNAALQAEMPVGTSTLQDILPYGADLNFSAAINSVRFQYNQLQYPQVDPKTEVGISAENLIPPASQASPQTSVNPLSASPTTLK